MENPVHIPIDIKVGDLAERLRHALRGQFSDQELIEDAVAEGILAVLKRLRKRKRVDDPASYAFIAAKHYASRCKRRESAAKKAILSSVAPGREDVDDDPTGPIEWSELSARVMAAVAGSLTPEQAWLIQEHFYSGRTYRDLADALDVSHTEVRRRLMRALESIRSAL